MPKESDPAHPRTTRQQAPTPEIDMHNSTAASLAHEDGAIADSRVTQCPKCDTAFRVTQQQLELANGRVRCGSCLDVFVAAQHWAATPDTPSLEIQAAPQIVATETAPQAAETTPPQKDSNEIEFSDAFLELDGKAAAPCSLTQAAISAEAEEGEEQWAKNILDDEESQAREPKNELLEAILAAPTNSPGDEAKAETAAPDSSEYNQDEFHTTESWMQELLGGEQQDTDAADIPTTAAIQAPEMAAEPDHEYIPEIFRDNKKLIDGIQAEPLEMHWGRHISPWMRHGLSAIAIVLACTALVAQYAWFNSERLARNPDYRTAVSQFCQLTRCALPAANDISRIKNSNLVVLKHPRTEGALLLDTILTNYASFEQAYPSLYVQFSDLQNQSVAARVFTPQEYLRGDLVGSTSMPVRRPIHLSLELVDPGDRAVNYKIQLLAANSP
jgi:predicted Zn finger-like uncharacterized protein